MGQEAGSDAIYTFEPFRLEARTHILTKKGKKVRLAEKPMNLLLALVERRGELVPKEELFKKVWGNTIVDDNNLDQQISVLRKALGEGPKDKKYIMTVPREGYSFVARVEIIAPIEEGEADEDYVIAYETVEGGTADFTTGYETVEAGTVDFVNSDKTVEGTDESHVYPCQTAKADENLHRKRPSTKRPQKKRK
jgi:DNA-binding winged helix-turn-helix (wHTH) protein